MSLYSKIRGTFETLFQIGKAGPQLKNNGGNVDVRNPADAAYVNVRGADPLTNDDLLTLRYFNANSEGVTGLKFIKMPLALVTKVSTSIIPDNATILHCILDVTTPYSAGTTVQVSRTGGGATVMGTTDNDPTIQAQHEVPQATSWGATGAGTVTATIAGAPSVGVAMLYIGYSIPNDIS
jgi:hypothetical protein